MKKLLALLLALLMVLSVAACSDSDSGFKSGKDDDDDKVSDRDDKNDRDEKDEPDEPDDEDDEAADETAKDIAEEFVTAVFNADGKRMINVMNEEFFEGLAEEDNLTVSEAKDEVVDMMEETFGELVDMFNQVDSWDLDVTAESVKDARSSALKSAQGDYDDVGFDFEIEAMKTVTVSVELDFDHAGEHMDADFEVDIPVIKVNGEWGLEFLNAMINLGTAMEEVGEEMQEGGSTTPPEPDTPVEPDTPSMPSTPSLRGKYTPEEAAEVYIEATFTADGELMMSTVLESVVQSMADTVGMTTDEFYDYFDEYLQSQLDSITESIGAWTYEYAYDSTEDGDDYDIEYAQESYDELNLGLEIQDYKYVVYNVSVDGESGSDNDNISVGVVQIDGKWYVDIFF